MCCVRGNSTEGDIIAIIIQEKYFQQYCKILALEEIAVKEFKVGAQCKLKNDSDIKWQGEMAALKNGVAVIEKETSILHVWRFADRVASEFVISDGKCQIAGMRAMDNVLGSKELLALAFSNNKSIGFYAIELNGLVKVREVQLEFNPFGLLWLERKRTLLVQDEKGTAKELYAIRVTERDLATYKVTIDENKSFTALSWCVLIDKNGNEKAIAIFDCQSNYVKIFDMA